MQLKLDVEIIFAIIIVHCQTPIHAVLFMFLDSDPAISKETTRNETTWSETTKLLSMKFKIKY